MNEHHNSDWRWTHRPTEQRYEVRLFLGGIWIGALMTLAVLLACVSWVLR